MLLPLVMMVGVIAALLRSAFHKRLPEIPDLNLGWLVVLSFLLQFAIFFIPSVSQQISTNLVALVFSLSLGLLVIFALVNWNEAGFALLGLGLVLNMAVVVANGGLMPISPDTISQLSLPEEFINHHVVVGKQFAMSKDVVLLKDDTWFWWLSDVVVIPAKWLWWRPIGIAFSIGDVLVSLGAIRFFWQSSANTTAFPPKNSNLSLDSHLA